MFFSFFLCCHGQLKMLTWDFLTKSIFTSMTSYVPQKNSGLFTIHHGLFWRAEDGKKERNSRWSHVRLESCTADFRMEQTHLFSCWLPALKSPEDRSTVRTHGLHRRVFPITGFHSRHLSLSSPLTKMTNTFLCSQRVSLHLSNHGRKPYSVTMHRLRGDLGIFGRLKNSNLWMDSNGKLWWGHNVLNPSKTVL